MYVIIFEFFPWRISATFSKSTNLKVPILRKSPFLKFNWENWIGKQLFIQNLFFSISLTDWCFRSLIKKISRTRFPRESPQFTYWASFILTKCSSAEFFTSPFILWWPISTRFTFAAAGVSYQISILICVS